MSDVPPKKAVDLLHLLTFTVGLTGTGFGAYVAMDSRVTRLETRVADAHLAEIPQRLATIETLLKHREAKP